MADQTDNQEQAAGGPEPRLDHRWPRLGLLVTVLLIVAVVVALPFAFASMQTQLLGRQQETLYEFPSGVPITAAAVTQLAANERFYNFAITDVDEANATVDIAFSAQRNCPGPCPSVRLVVAALGGNGPLRQGLPPSVVINLGPQDRVYADAITLPVEGWPSLYPFDTYSVQLAVALGAVADDGSVSSAPPAEAAGEIVGTVENAASDLLMAPPRPLDPATVAHPADAGQYLGVLELSFGRPLYLRVLGVILPLLIALSTALSVATRGVGDLLVGIGSIVIGIWGVRSVMVPSGFPVVTTIDLSLSLIILLLLLAIVVRSAGQLHRRAELPRLRPPLPGRGVGKGTSREP